MAATPQSGTMSVRNSRGITVPVDFYVSDVANALVNWDNGRGAAAGTPDFYSPPEDVVITDFSISTGLADTTKAQPTINNMGTGAIVRWANHVNTLSNRGKINLLLRRGTALRMIQLA